jgi:DNA-binding NarL/FixJ family response regulator
VDKIRILLAEDHVIVKEGTRELVQREQDAEVVAEAGGGYSRLNPFSLKSLKQASTTSGS